MRTTPRRAARILKGSHQCAIISILLISAGCAYFNTFYNATSYYNSGIKLLETGGASDTEAIPRPASEALGIAIEKSLKVIEEYPDSRYVDDAFFIVGKSHFHRREYGLAERYLQQLLEEYPWSPFADEVRIWLAKVHAQMGLNEAVEEDLAPILEMEDPPREFLTEIYILRGETALREARVEQAILAFKEAAETAVESSQKAAIYYRLYTLVDEQEDYENALVFLDRYSRITPVESERINSRLLRVQLLQKMDDFEGAYREIRNMVALTEFASIIPGLQLELGKIEYVRGGKNEALDRFIDVLEEYANLPEGSEAAFRAGEIYLTDLHGISEAESHFKRVRRNTTYYQPAQAKLKQINTINSVVKTMSSLRTQLGLETGEATADEEFDSQRGTRRTPRMEEPETVTVVDTSEAAIDTTQVREDLAYAMFRYGEILLFEMSDSSGGQEIMADIVLNFEETRVAPQAAYV